VVGTLSYQTGRVRPAQMAHASPASRNELNSAFKSIEPPDGHEGNCSPSVEFSRPSCNPDIDTTPFFLLSA
jgi:hypothetical protein